AGDVAQRHIALVVDDFDVTIHILDNNVAALETGQIEICPCRHTNLNIVAAESPTRKCEDVVPLVERNPIGRGGLTDGRAFYDYVESGMSSHGERTHNYIHSHQPGPRWVCPFHDHPTFAVFGVSDLGCNQY